MEIQWRDDGTYHIGHVQDGTLPSDLLIPQQ